jgi:hypothetical protein
MKLSALIRTILLFLLIAAVSSCFYMVKNNSSMVFSHTLHLEMEIECLTCHEGIENSENDLNSHLPSMNVCEECHEEVNEAGSCSMCHPDLAIKPDSLHERSTNLTFSHKLHVEMDVECNVCHPDARTSLKSSEILIPLNPFQNNEHTGLCAVCHEPESPDDCLICHADIEKTSSLFSTRTDLIFSHNLHIEMDLECRTCHVSIIESDTIMSSRLPEMGICAECHDEVDNDCTMCHKQIKNPVLLPGTETALNFSHKFHMDEGADECSFCHEKVTISNTPDINKIPEHKDCFQCHHEEDYDNMLCSKCHRNLGSKELKPITKFSHEGNFIKRHKDIASKNNRQVLCAQCHMEEFCMDCHSTNPGIKASEKTRFDIDRTFIHRGDYQSRHQIDARRDPGLCVTCHRTSFCQNCHSRKGYALDFRNQYDIHPPDFLASHGRAARRDILTCAVCHDRGAATSCIECHAINPSGITGPGGNPHPPGFKSKLSKSQDAVCILCHGN